MTYEQRTIAVVVLSQGKEIFDESATTVRIDDEAGGEFVVVEQHLENHSVIRMDPEEWPHIRRAINQMVRKIKTPTNK